MLLVTHDLELAKRLPDHVVMEDGVIKELGGLGKQILLALILLASSSLSAAEIIKKMTVRGNRKVESEAILTILNSKVGTSLSAKTVREDILSLYDMGYFSDVRFYKDDAAGGINLIVEVREKPAVIEIIYTGMDELGEDDFKDKLETELFAILDEGAITNDVRTIEKAYLEKGFYLAKAVTSCFRFPIILSR